MEILNKINKNKMIMFKRATEIINYNMQTYYFQKLKMIYYTNLHHTNKPYQFIGWNLPQQTYYKLRCHSCLNFTMKYYLLSYGISLVKVCLKC